MALANKSARSKGRANGKSAAKARGKAKTAAPVRTEDTAPKSTARAAKPAKSTTIDESLAERAFAKLEPDYRALKSTEVLRVNADVAAAAAVALRALDRVEPWVASFSKELRRFDASKLDRLRTLAFGAWYAALQARPQEIGADSFDALVNEGLALRQQFVIAAGALAARNLFDAKTLKDLEAGVGHRDLAGDLTTFASIFTKNRARYAGKTAIEADEVKRAAEIGSALFAIVAKRAKRRQVGTSRDPAGDTKARAWTLLARAYDELRRAVFYVRWAEHDANEIAPSLFDARGSGRPRTRDAKSEVTKPGVVLTRDAEEKATPVVDADDATAAASSVGEATKSESTEPNAARVAKAKRGGEPFA